MFWEKGISMANTEGKDGWLYRYASHLNRHPDVRSSPFDPFGRLPQPLIRKACT